MARKLIDIAEELDKFVTSLEEREAAYRANNLKYVYSVEDQEYIEVPC